MVARAVSLTVVLALLLLGALLPEAMAGTEAADGSARLCAGYSGLPDGDGPHAGMVWIAGGSFTLGDDEERPEERPAQRVSLSGFWIDRTEVTNAEFARFVAATGYRTVAERGLTAADRPDLPEELRVPGATVFTPPANIRDLVDIGQWWRYVPGADWRHPQGPGSSIDSLGNFPVVDVAFEDARAYAQWRGRSLPTEAQWEFAARGGLDGATYAWGDSYAPDGTWRANSWQGFFPLKDSGADGFKAAAPVGCFPPNGYGLFDMRDTVWAKRSEAFTCPHSGAAVGLQSGSNPD